MSLKTRKNDEKDFVLKRFTNIEVFKTAGNHPFSVIFDLKETQLFFWVHFIHFLMRVQGRI